MRDRLVPLTIWIALILSIVGVDVLMAPTPTNQPPSFAVAVGR